MRHITHTLLFIFAFAVFASAQTPTIDQSLNHENRGRAAHISPDGRYVAYQVQETNWEDNAFETEIWIAVTSTGERYQLTNAKKSSSNPQWSPDSKRIAFVSDRDGKRQIYLIAPNGGEALQLDHPRDGRERIRRGRRTAGALPSPPAIPKARRARTVRKNTASSKSFRMTTPSLTCG